jgi:hypothetical protein
MKDGDSLAFYDNELYTRFSGFPLNRFINIVKEGRE